MFGDEIIASVIVIVRNDIRIESCLDSLINQTFPSIRREIMVVDNDSIGQIANIIKRYPVRYLKEERVGMGWARNKGLFEAKGKYIVFIDADCIAEPDWLEMIIKGFTDDNIGIVGGKILKQEGNNLIERASRDLVIGQQTTLQYLPMYTAPYVVTANAAYRRDVLLRIGGFDPNFFSGGDVDISWRIAIEGFKITIQQKSVVYHANRSSTGQHFKQFYRYGLGHALLFKKYKKKTKRTLLINKYPVNQLLKITFIDMPNILFYTLKGRYSIIDWVRGYLSFIQNIALVCGNIHGAIKFKVLFI